MTKSADAFRTISEVADWLGIQAHVLRFWESKFTQVKPIKRAGGRRYYRPADMQLLGGIKTLLHDDGLTIKGVQKILREDGMGHVASLSIPLDEADKVNVEIDAVQFPPEDPKPDPEGVVLPFDSVTEAKEGAEYPDIAEESQASEAEKEAPQEIPAAPSPEPTAKPAAHNAQAGSETGAAEVAPLPEPEPQPEREPLPETAPVSDAATVAPSPDVVDDPAKKTPPATETEPSPIDAAAETPSFSHRRSNLAPTPASEEASTASESKTDMPDPEPVATSEETPAEPEAVQKPRNIDLPPFTPEEEHIAAPALLSRVVRTQSLNRDQAAKVTPLLAQLTALREQMAQKRRPTPAR